MVSGILIRYDKLWCEPGLSIRTRPQIVNKHLRYENLKNESNQISAILIYFFNVSATVHIWDVENELPTVKRTKFGFERSQFVNVGIRWHQNIVCCVRTRKPFTQQRLLWSGGMFHRDSLCSIRLYFDYLITCFLNYCTICVLWCILSH